MSYQLITLNILSSNGLKLSFGRTENLINFILLFIENGTAKTNGIYLFGRLLFEVSRGGMGVIRPYLYVYITPYKFLPKFIATFIAAYAFLVLFKYI